MASYLYIWLEAFYWVGVDYVCVRLVIYTEEECSGDIKPRQVQNPAVLESILSGAKYFAGVTAW